MNIPEPKSHLDVAINQHLVPQCYMREWSYNGGNSVWIYNKKELFNETKPENSDWSITSKSTKKINAIDYFHDLKAGSNYLPDDALEEIFGFLSAFTINLDGEKLETLTDLNRNYHRHEEWHIVDSTGNSISDVDKAKIEAYLNESRYVYIETEWNKAYENNWRSYITGIEEKVRKLKESVPPEEKEAQPAYGITKYDLDLIFKYLLIYDWRSFEGNDEFNKAIECVRNIIPEIMNLDISEEDRTHQEDTTVIDAFAHDLRLKYFIQFLKDDTGILRTCIDQYEKNLQICFLLTDKEHPFITSNTPAFVFVREDGYKEHILVARPTMIVSLGRGEKNHFIVSNLLPEQVEIYNRGIAKHGHLLIVPEENYDIATLFAEKV
ncbi:MAG: DUF4238 domain-containing protein [Hespellia sp.]|nr:DUF4238 domain-containing protein [Hespellia sp.]